MNHLSLNRVAGQTQPTIEFSTENQESPVENTQQNFQKQFANNVNRNQESRKAGIGTTKYKKIQFG